MFAQLCLLIGALVGADVQLANGIRIVELPPASGTFEILAGYQAGTSEFDAAIAAYLFSTESVRAMTIAAYGAGGQVEFISEPDRMAVRVTVPSWMKPLIDAQLPGFFAAAPAENSILLARAIASVTPRPAPDFRASVEEQLRALMTGAQSTPEKLSEPEVEQFFHANYGTDRAFVLVSGSADPAIERVPARQSVKSDSAVNVEAETLRTLRFKPDLPTGAVIVASPVPSVYYEAWYATLLLDRLIQQVVPGRPSTVLIPRLVSYYYRLEFPVPAGQFDDVVESKVLEDLERLQFTRASANDLEAARASAIQYLEQESIQRWFRSLGIEPRRLEGIERVRSFTADDIRVAARELLAGHAIASWSPMPKQITIEVENLSDTNKPAGPAVPARASLAELTPIPFQAFPPHAHNRSEDAPPERLSSGVSIVASSRHAILVAPQDLKLFDQEPDSEVLKSYGVYRPDRILVMAPPESLARMKDLWASFAGNRRDASDSLSTGAVANADLPALVVLKMMLDRRLMEMGLWNDVHVRITAAEGSRLTIAPAAGSDEGNGSDETRRRVLDWINTIALETPSADLLAWAREAAIHHLDEIKPDLQGLLWQRDAQFVLPDLQGITADHVQAVAKTYFQ